MRRWKEKFIETVMDELYSIGYDYIGSGHYDGATVAKAVKKALGEEDGTEEAEE
jgi:hypothetical protein